MSRPLTRAMMAAGAAMLSFPLLLGPAAAHDSSGEVFLDSAVAIDRANGSVTLPLFKGKHDGKTVWYVVTESSNRDQAERRGINWAPKMANALGTKAVQRVRVSDGTIAFKGTVNFALERVVVPGPQGFPPEVAKAGAKGDADYSPLITPNGRTVLNATQVANASGVHDAVLGINYRARTVKMDTLNGFYEDNRVQYLHQEASVELVAAIEGSTWAPNLDAAPGVGSNDRETSARSAIIPIVNGPRGVNNPRRQGLQSALLGEGDPLNITQEVPDDQEYSPVWDVTPAVWTNAAIRAGERVRLENHKDVADLFEDGLIVSGGMGPRNESLEGLRALPGISNCPVVIEFD